jgi:hypothetical protein
MNCRRAGIFFSNGAGLSLQIPILETIPHPRPGRVAGGNQSVRRPRATVQVKLDGVDNPLAEQEVGGTWVV